MTPSEIAEALEARHKYDKINYPPASPLDRQAAATIRELEARASNAEGMVVEANNSLFGSQGFFGDDALHLSREIEALKLSKNELWRKLKIATEALEAVRDGASEVALITIADQALTRIEEPSQ